MTQKSKSVFAAVHFYARDIMWLFVKESPSFVLLDFIIRFYAAVNSGSVKAVTVRLQIQIELILDKN